MSEADLGPDSRAPLGIVSGSGFELIGVFDDVDDSTMFSEYFDLPRTVLSGHARTFTRGSVGERPLILQTGRLHFYEGFDYKTVVKPVDLLAEWGVTTILFTNAAGGLLPDLRPGDLVAVDTIETWPFIHWPERPARLETQFQVPGCDRTGTYFWMHGPTYETPAEIGTLQALGASVVGMSTAPEVQRCRELGIRAAVISCVTNNCCRHEPLTHEEVLRVARCASDRLCAVLRRALLGEGADSCQT